MRCIAGFIVAPLGVQALFLLAAVGNCVVSPSAENCGERLFFAGVATAAFIFPFTWVLQAIIGIPTIVFLRYFGVLNAWSLVSVAAVAGALFYLPTVQDAFKRGEFAAVWALVYGALFGASVAAVMWLVAFRQGAKGGNKVANGTSEERPKSETRRTV